MIYTIDKTLTENKDKVPEADAKTLRYLIDEGKKAIETQDDAAVTAALEKLEKEAHRLAGAMYGNGTPGAPPPDAPSGGEAGGPPPGGPAKGKEGVIDAEFEEAN